ncbi:MAG: hypothetical protein U0791_25685 [Gemmataceae bacterium]
MHRIRLGPPWEAVPQPEGGTRHTRRFGRPRTLDSPERVWLVAELPEGAEVLLNGVKLEASASFAAEVTDRLEPRNELVMIVPNDATPVGVALEIR